MTDKKKQALTPPDEKRCQAEVGGAFTLGSGLMRCGKKPSVILTEKEPGKDGQRGSMSVCPECFEVFKQRHSVDTVTVERLDEHAIVRKIKQYIAEGAEQLSRKYRSIGVPPGLSEGQTYLEMLRERDPVAWKQHEDRARSQLIHAEEKNHIKLTFEEFNIWLELRDCKPVASPPAPYNSWREYWDNNDKHPVKVKEPFIAPPMGMNEPYEERRE